MGQQTLPRFAALQSRVGRAVTSHLANALLSAGGRTWRAMYDVELPEDSPFLDAVTVQRRTIRIYGDPGLGAILHEGAACTVVHADWPDGQACRISTPVETDAAGFASFDVVAE